MNCTMTVGEIRTAVIKLKSLRSNLLLRTKSKIEMSKASLSSDKISGARVSTSTSEGVVVSI